MPAICRDQVVGCRLTNLFQTRWSKPVCHLEGVGDAFYCTVILGLSSGALLVLSDEDLHRWNGNEPLQDLTLAEHRMEASATPTGNAIIGVATDQVGILYVLLAGGIALSLDCGYGSCLWVGDTPSLSTHSIDDAELELKDWWSGERIALTPGN